MQYIICYIYNTLIIWTQTITLTGGTVNNISQKIRDQVCETTFQSSLARYSLAELSLAKLSLVKLSLAKLNLVELSLIQLMGYDW